ncbi:unnamed protein product [Plutella xylostella]|uniref:(diamondback moth) hypothetical protein n=1 Tax=Plutella xylostella TaxID=51655 RepID=A0A8S4FMK5_PLUXY|nr:unnamed protein product [Plutella xylostella]
MPPPPPPPPGAGGDDVRSRPLAGACKVSASFENSLSVCMRLYVAAFEGLAAAECRLRDNYVVETVVCKPEPADSPPKKSRGEEYGYAVYLDPFAQLQYRALSAFRPWGKREPALQHPERVVRVVDCARFHQDFQPNVALKPLTPPVDDVTSSTSPPPSDLAARLLDAEARLAERARRLDEREAELMRREARLEEREAQLARIERPLKQEVETPPC